MSTVQFRSYELEYDPVKLETLLWIVVAYAFVGDIVTTHFGVQVGLVEANPFVSDSVYAYGIPGIIAVKTIAVLFGWLCRRLLDAEHRWIIPLCLGVPWAVATVYNMYLIVVVTV